MILISRIPFSDNSIRSGENLVDVQKGKKLYFRKEKMYHRLWFICYFLEMFSMHVLNF